MTFSIGASVIAFQKAGESGEGAGRDGLISLFRFFRIDGFLVFVVDLGKFDEIVLSVDIRFPLSGGTVDVDIAECVCSAFECDLHIAGNG